MSICKKTYWIAGSFLAFSANASDPFEPWEGQTIYRPESGWTQVVQDPAGYGLTETPIKQPKEPDGSKMDGSQITNPKDMPLTTSVPPASTEKRKNRR